MHSSLRIVYRSAGPAWVIPPPGSPTLMGYEEIQYVGWDTARPKHTVACAGFNPWQARTDAALKLGVCVSRVAVRRALPPDFLPSRGVA